MHLNTVLFYQVFVIIKYVLFLSPRVFVVGGKLPSAVNTYSEDLKASNPYNLQTETLIWEDSSAQCITICQTSKFSLERRVIKFDQKSGKCECFRNLEDGLFASKEPQIAEKAVFVYTGIHFSANFFMNIKHRWLWICFARSRSKIFSRLGAD